MTSATQLAQHHREELHRSGLSDATIEAAGIYSGNGDIATLLGWRPKQFSWGEGWVIPYRTADGSDTGYARVKLDHPRHDEHGKAIKYEAPVRELNRAYFPPGFRDAVNRSGFVVITEGEKKALAAMQAGFAAIGLPGVWSWQRKRPRGDNGKAFGQRDLIPDLAAIEWKDQRVFIVFDSDAADKLLVRLAEHHLAETLPKAGAAVRIVRLPGSQEHKVGLDDFLLEHGPIEFRKLMDAAQECEAPPKLALMDWARIWLDDNWTSSTGKTLRCHAGQFFVYDGKR